MTEQVFQHPDIYRIDIPLTGNPLKNLNCYVIMDGGESLVIDTGFRNEECLQVLMEGLEELGISPEHTRLFVTHLHSDHSGLAQYFDYPDTCIYMGKTEHRYLQKLMSGAIRQLRDLMYLAEGYPPEKYYEAENKNPAKIYMPNREFAVTELQDGDEILVGSVKVTALEMPGHTPGLMCCYLEKEKIMFTSDHVLFDITPNITNWPEMENPLGCYLKNLDRILEYEVKTAFPAHRNLSDKTLRQRVEEIKLHHKKRLEEILEIIKKQPGGAYEIAAGLTWSLRGKSWEQAPEKQKWFAVGETLSHLEYLIEKGKVVRKQREASGKMYNIYTCELNGLTEDSYNFRNK
ncbi:MAG: MBL fold metallo-hydrolase [Lachnospiraceae bacterium]|jgi:glyoxylase-like metal-dependent hydrolase (beta-lactamase superfamily II)|nr:MBL fold metallo-hydrolase [Lachnospiraceae bacterium]